mmetsp:Transcript_2067/g.3113  ORF Transcript_2067/g.3113 Transcript_2067/m.3113 type:complete len:81 (-) Transcript_2067:217-459(-)
MFGMRDVGIRTGGGKMVLYFDVFGSGGNPGFDLYVLNFDCDYVCYEGGRLALISGLVRFEATFTWRSFIIGFKLYSLSLT